MGNGNWEAWGCENGNHFDPLRDLDLAIEEPRSLKHERRQAQRERVY
jgi:hypothetical protein